MSGTPGSRAARRALAFLAAIGLLVGAEAALRAKWGPPSKEPVWGEFGIYYEDIYKKFFRLTLSRSWEPVYVSNRERAVPQEFPALKETGAFRVFVVGGSVAMEFGYDDPTRLKEFFARSLPGRSIEVIGCGMGGYDSFRDALVQREVLDHRPDAIVLLSGNNEYYTPETTNAGLYRLKNRLRRLWLFRWPLDRLSPPRPALAPTLSERLASFEKNLTLMARRARERKVPMIFCTLPANIRDMPPLRSRPRWNSSGYLDAWNAFDAGDDRLASVEFERYVSAHPDDPSGHYWLAKLLDRRGLYSRAREHYSRAVDLDDPGERCSPARNDVIRRVARKNGMIVADLAKEFESVAEEGIPGGRIFADQVHWRQEYYPFVSSVILRSIDEAVRSGNPYLPPPVAWDWRWLDSLGPRLPRPPISRQMQDRYGDEAVYKGMTYAMLAPGTIEEGAISSFEREAARDPARLDFLTASIENLRPGLEAYPWFRVYEGQLEEGWTAIRVHVGETYRRRKDYGRALAYFDGVLRREPGLDLALLLKAKTLASMGRMREAKTCLSRLSPGARGLPQFAYWLRRLGD
ncbi:MAG: tetratricopeptide repeat protein [Elusimicrobiota bacterium]